MSDELSRLNVESWRKVLDFYEMIAQDFFDGDHISPLLGVVRALHTSDVAKQFRAGHRREALIISTAPLKKGWTRLEDDEPLVVVTLDRRTKMLLIEYQDRGSGRPLGRYMCSERECTSYLQPVLNRLWEDTRSRRAT
jgi:hypothetical protein